MPQKYHGNDLLNFCVKLLSPSLYYVFTTRAASTSHLNWTAVGDDQRLTEGDSRQQGTCEQHHRATNARS